MCVCKTSAETNWPNRARAEAQLIIRWKAGLPGICYMREWAAWGVENFPLYSPLPSYKLVPPFTRSSCGIPRAWWGANDWECATLTLLEEKKKKIVIKHFVDTLESRLNRCGPAGGGRWNRPNRASNVPCDGESERGEALMSLYTPSELSTRFDVATAPRAWLRPVVRQSE